MLQKIGETFFSSGNLKLFFLMSQTVTHSRCQVQISQFPITLMFSCLAHWIFHLATWISLINFSQAPQQWEITFSDHYCTLPFALYRSDGFYYFSSSGGVPDFQRWKQPRAFGRPLVSFFLFGVWSSLDFHAEHSTIFSRMNVLPCDFSR